MSGGAIFQQALRVLQGLPLDPSVRRDILPILEAGRLTLPLISEAGFEAKLPREEWLARGVGVYLLTCVGNLTDDLIDGECTYISPLCLGPCYQYILHNLAFSCLARTAIPQNILAQASLEMTLAAAPEPLEIRAETFDHDLYMTIAEGIAGRQWAAYFTLLWAQTPLATRAERVGRNAGVAGYIALDIQSHDRRFFTMSPEDRKKTVALGLEAARALREEGLRCIELTLPTIEPTLKEHA